MRGSPLEEIADTGAAAGLGAGVVGSEEAVGGEPERAVFGDDLGRVAVAVADDLEEAAAVLKQFVWETAVGKQPCNANLPGHGKGWREPGKTAVKTLAGRCVHVLTTGLINLK